jgi:hypothetical protein
MQSDAVGYKDDREEPQRDLALENPATSQCCAANLRMNASYFRAPMVLSRNSFSFGGGILDERKGVPSC